MAGKNSLCDVSSENCSTFSVFGQDFLSGPGLGCRVRPITVEETDPANWKYLEDRLEAVVEFVDVTTIRCSMSQSVLDTTQLSLQSVTLEVELTNTGTVWSSGIFLTIHNSTCTSCAHQSSPLLPKLCRQSDDVCRSDSKVSLLLSSFSSLEKARSVIQLRLHIPIKVVNIAKMVIGTIEQITGLFLQRLAGLLSFQY